jgi:hypothetical protein
MWMIGRAGTPRILAEAQIALSSARTAIGSERQPADGGSPDARVAQLVERQPSKSHVVERCALNLESTHESA